jgi:hypothetical protein
MGGNGQVQACFTKAPSSVQKSVQSLVIGPLRVYNQGSILEG